MAVETKPENDVSVTSLVSGIISDAQDLFKQQFELLKHDVREDIRKAKDASLMLVCGLSCSLVGLLLLGLTLAHLLAWAVPTLPLWACYGICGGVLAAVGGGLSYAGLSKFETVDPVPRASAEALKENVQWITNPK